MPHESIAYWVPNYVTKFLGPPVIQQSLEDILFCTIPKNVDFVFFHLAEQSVRCALGKSK